jgi:hypothetical protein
MRVIAVGGALVASALLIQGGAAGASSGGSDDHSDSRSAKTLTFDVRFSPFNYTDLGQPGPSAADVIVFHDTLLQHGRRVGDEVGSCVLVDAGGLANCTAVVRLGQEDTITYALVNAPPPRKVVAITGGSGAYRTAQGDGVLVEHGDGTGTLVLTVIDD